MITSSLLFAIYFLMLTVPGFVILRSLAREERDILILAPLSVFVGLSVFLFGVNLLLYLVPFPTANKVLLPGLLIIAVAVGVKRRVLTWNDCAWNLSRAEKRWFLLVTGCITLLFIFLFWGTFYGDNLYHSTLALSIQRGNIHPLRWPWYPDYCYAYHYAYALMKASTQDFCGINQFYSDKPWCVVFLVGLFSFVVGFVKRGFHGSFRIGLAAGVCFLFFCGFSTVPMLMETGRLVLHALHQPAKETYDALIDLYKSPPYVNFSFSDASVHKPMLMRFPVYAALVYLVVNGPKRERLDVPYILVGGVLLGFLCLCDESLFGLSGIGLALYFAMKSSSAGRGQRLRLAAHGAAVLAIGGILAVVEGGFLTTVLFHGGEQYAPGSVYATGGGYGKLHLRDQFAFATYPLFSLNGETWALFGRNYVLPMFCFLALQIGSLRFRASRPAEWKDTYLIWSVTFWVGFLFAGVFTVLPSDLVMAARMYVWPVVCLSAGVRLWLWIEPGPSHSGDARQRLWLGTALILFLIAGTLFRIGTGCALSAAFQFSNEKKQIEKSVAFGHWLCATIPRDARTFGFDPRYTGLFSFGGNPFLDALVLPRSELEAYERAKTVVDYQFLRRNKVTHLILRTEDVPNNKDALSDRARFAEIDGRYSGQWRVYRLLD